MSCSKINIAGNVAVAKLLVLNPKSFFPLRCNTEDQDCKHLFAYKHFISISRGY